MNLVRTVCSMVLLLTWVPWAAASGPRGSSPHFVQGELRAGLSWDNLSAMNSGVLKFGGTAGIYLANGIELGFEQQFVVPPNSTSQTRSWGYLRVVPFRDLPITPFVSLRAGYFTMPEESASAVGAGLGAVFFIDDYFAFEASLCTQLVIDPRGGVTRQTALDWRLVLYY